MNNLNSLGVFRSTQIERLPRLIDMVVGRLTGNKRWSEAPGIVTSGGSTLITPPTKILHLSAVGPGKNTRQVKYFRPKSGAVVMWFQPANCA
ncbi:MAG: hypothetical protein R3C68_06635 [Myxococcota bacterium]